MTDKTEELNSMRARAMLGGGQDRIDKVHAKGRLTARERIVALLDKDTFHEYDLFVEHEARDFDMDKKVLHGDGVVTGTGKIAEQPICISVCRTMRYRATVWSPVMEL